LEVSSAWELQLKAASQQVQKPLDMEAKDATLLKAIIKQHSEDHD
jgi:hypothetical protein